MLEKPEDIDKIDIDVMDIVEDGKDMIGKFYELETNIALADCQAKIFIR